MPKPRKKWKTVDQPDGVEATWTSEAKAYEYVNGARNVYAGGNHSITGVTVYQHDATYAWSGREPWALFDTHDFARES